MSIFSAIGHFFVGLFDKFKKAFLSLSPEQQAALQQGTGLVAIINGLLQSTPAEIRAAIKAAHPELDEAQLEAALFHLAGTFGLPYASLDDAILALQKYLSEKEGKDWAVASHTAAVVLSTFLAPKETRVAQIVLLIEWCYRHFIKKDAE